MSRALLAAVLLAVAGATPAPALYVRLDGDQLTLRADHAPLHDILTALSRMGVEVKADPAIDPLITASCTERDLQRALDEYLAPHSFVLGWDVVKGPLHDIPRLTELQLFEPGARERMRPVLEKTMRVLRRGDGAEYVADQVLVAVKPGTTVEAFRKLVAQLGGSVVGSVPKLGVYLIQLQPGSDVSFVVAQLKQNAIIEQAEPNFVTRLPNRTLVTKAETLTVPKLPRGQGAPIAVLDSGLLSASALGDTVAGSYDAMSPDRAISDPDGHGTQMALIASGAVSPEGAGPAASAGTPVLAVRAFDDEGRTSNFALLRGLEYAMQNGARVVSLSWGSETSSDFIEQALNYAMSQGLVVVAAAGNEPTGRAVYPAAYPGVVSVVALQGDGTRWAQSNYGPTVDVAAPGVATLPVGHDGPAGTYAGTSIATAYVSGQLAQYFAAHPGATRDQALAALSAALRDAGDPGTDPYYGRGVLDDASAAQLTGTAQRR